VHGLQVQLDANRITASFQGLGVLELLSETRAHQHQALRALLRKLGKSSTAEGNEKKRNW
jgi:hypothetical protein